MTTPDPDIGSAFGDAVAAETRRQGRDPRDVARALGISDHTLLQIELGADPGPVLRARIASVLGMPDVDGPDEAADA